MRSRRGGCVCDPRSHHPTRLRGHPSSGRRGFILLGALSAYPPFAIRHSPSAIRLPPFAFRLHRCLMARHLAHHSTGTPENTMQMPMMAPMLPGSRLIA